MRGYFGFGVEGISKARNVGSIFRSAHAFGASFVFAVTPSVNVREVYQTDTSGTHKHVPLYQYDTIQEMPLPRDCALVGVELTDDAIELPSFHHPERAAYIVGPERASLSQGVVDRCDYVVKIPTKFCVNVGVAAAVLMYDRMVSKGKFADRPVRTGGPDPMADAHKHVYGQPIFRRGKPPSMLDSDT